MENLPGHFVTTTEAAAMLSIHPKSVGFLVRKGKIPAVKISNRWLIPIEALESFSESYEGRRGHPRVKRKYTKRSAKWSSG